MCRMSVNCADPKLHFSTKPEDIAFCNAVRASMHAEECKTDLKMGREPEVLQYGEPVMAEGEAMEEARRVGVALSVRFAEAREASFRLREVHLLGIQARKDKREEVKAAEKVEAARLAWEQARFEQDRQAEGRQLARMQQELLTGERAETRMWGGVMAELVAEPKRKQRGVGGRELARMEQERLAGERGEPTRKRRGASGSPPPAKKK